MLPIEYFELKELYMVSMSKYSSILQKKARIKKWLYYHKKVLTLRNNFLGMKDFIYYATFTFKEEKLINNDFKRKSFTKYLKENHIKAYTLNKDYGDDKGRFHLHGFIYSDKRLKNDSINLYGWVKLKDIKGKGEEEEERIINYITNYVIKNNYFANKMLTCYFEGNIMK